jgi:hypothetical protein
MQKFVAAGGTFQKSFACQNLPFPASWHLAEAATIISFHELPISRF